MPVIIINNNALIIFLLFTLPTFAVFIFKQINKNTKKKCLRLEKLFTCFYFVGWQTCCNGKKHASQTTCKIYNWQYFWPCKKLMQFLLEFLSRCIGPCQAALIVCVFLFRNIITTRLIAIAFILGAFLGPHNFYTFYTRHRHWQIHFVKMSKLTASV